MSESLDLIKQYRNLYLEAKRMSLVEKRKFLKGAANSLVYPTLRVGQLKTIDQIIKGESDFIINVSSIDSTKIKKGDNI